MSDLAWLEPTLNMWPAVPDYINSETIKGSLPACDHHCLLVARDVVPKASEGSGPIRLPRNIGPVHHEARPSHGKVEGLAVILHD